MTANGRNNGNRPPAGGRPKGSRNKTTVTLKEAMLTAAALTGEPKPVYNSKGKLIGWKATGTGELVGYLQWLALYHPPTFGHMLGKIFPLQIKASVDYNVELTDARDRLQHKLEDLSRRLRGPVIEHNENEPRIVARERLSN